jgi:hypothetical protein
MNRELLSETRSEPTYTDVGNGDIAYVHGWTVVGQCRSNCRGANIRHPWGSHPHPTAMDGGSAGFAGAKNLPCG